MITLIRHATIGNTIMQVATYWEGQTFTASVQHYQVDSDGRTVLLLDSGWSTEEGAIKHFDNLLQARKTGE